MTRTPLELFPRFAIDQVRTALGDTPVVMVVGPWAEWKATLVRDLLDEDRTDLTLDDDTVPEAARSDPVGPVRSLDRIVIDEVQRHPDLLHAIKFSVHSDRRPGQLLLTGSADVLALPQLSGASPGEWPSWNGSPSRSWSSWGADRRSSGPLWPEVSRSRPSSVWNRTWSGSC